MLICKLLQWDIKHQNKVWRKILLFIKNLYTNLICVQQYCAQEVLSWAKFGNARDGEVTMFSYRDPNIKLNKGNFFRNKIIFQNWNFRYIWRFPKFPLLRSLTSNDTKKQKGKFSLSLYISDLFRGNNWAGFGTILEQQLRNKTIWWKY